MDLIKNLFKGDPYIWGIFLTLCLISIVESFSATSFLAFKSAEHYGPAMSHFTHLLFGTVVVLITLNFPPHIFRNIAGISYIITVVLLVAVLFTPKVNDASRYILGFQPSELAKFSLLSVVCGLLAQGQTEKGITKAAFQKILIFSGIVCLLIFPENFSTCALIGGVVFMLMFIGRVQIKRILGLVGVVTVLGALFVAVLFIAPDDMLKGRMDTWKQRIVRSTEETPKVEQSINDKNMQVQYGHMAIANGGVFGKGPGQSQMRDFLPLAFSDFIFAIIIEEGGLFLGLIVVFLYLFLLIRAAMIFLRCENIFQAFFLLGLSMIITFQAITNMAVGVDLIPVTGQPLPLLSRGGSSILMTSVYFGIIQSISRCVMENEEIKQHQLRQVEAGLGYFDEDGNYFDYENIDMETGEVLDYEPESETGDIEESEYNQESDIETDEELEKSEEEIYRY